MTVFLFISMLILLLGSIEVYVALALSSAAAVAIFTPLPLEVLAQKMFSGIDKFSLMAVPFFILAANVMRGGGISSRILGFSQSLIGHKKGGLAMTLVLSCMFFGAVSGSSPATVIAIGGIMYPAMIEAGYGKGFTIGLIASSSSVAVIIPPSIGMIVYGTVTGVSVGDLFIAGFIPGIVYGLMFIIFSYYYAVKNDLPTEKRSSISEIWTTFKKSAWALGIPGVIIIGIYSGAFTPTEAAAVAAVYAIIVAVFVYKELNFKDLVEEIIVSAEGTAQIMILLAAAQMFSWVLTRQQVPQALAQALLSQSSSKYFILIMFNIILLIVGMFIDGASSSTILAPLFLPIALSVGIDPIHLGIIMVVNGAIGMFTPPFGLNLFVSKGLSEDMTINSIIKGSVPFIALSLIAMILITFIPQISLLLPSVLK